MTIYLITKKQIEAEEREERIYMRKAGFTNLEEYRSFKTCLEFSGHGMIHWDTWIGDDPNEYRDVVDERIEKERRAGVS